MAGVVGEDKGVENKDCIEAITDNENKGAVEAALKKARGVKLGITNMGKPKGKEKKEKQGGKRRGKTVTMTVGHYI